MDSSDKVYRALCRTDKRAQLILSATDSPVLRSLERSEELAARLDCSPALDALLRSDALAEAVERTCRSLEAFGTASGSQKAQVVLPDSEIQSIRELVYDVQIQLPDVPCDELKAAVAEPPKKKFWTYDRVAALIALLLELFFGSLQYIVPSENERLLQSILETVQQIAEHIT